MKPVRASVTSIFSVLLPLVSSAVCGSEVYKWVEDNGVTHYAEAPPETSLSSLEVLDIDVPEAGPPAIANYQSALDVANSIEASRLERERVRLERDKLLLQERQQRQSELAAEQRYDRDGTAYYLPRYRHRPRHGRHPEPKPHRARNRPIRGDTQARANFKR